MYCAASSSYWLANANNRTHQCSFFFLTCNWSNTVSLNATTFRAPNSDIRRKWKAPWIPFTERLKWMFVPIVEKRSEIIPLKIRRQIDGQLENVCHCVLCEKNVAQTGAAAAAAAVEGRIKNAAVFILPSQCHYFCSPALLCSLFWNVILLFLCFPHAFVLTRFTTELSVRRWRVFLPALFPSQHGPQSLGI